MPQYTFHVAPGSGDEAETRVEVFENDEVAVHVARRLLGARRASIRVGRGVGDEIAWIGEWHAGARPAHWREAS